MIVQSVSADEQTLGSILNRDHHLKVLVTRECSDIFGELSTV